MSKKAANGPQHLSASDSGFKAKGISPVIPEIQYIKQTETGF